MEIKQIQNQNISRNSFSLNNLSRTRKFLLAFLWVLLLLSFPKGVAAGFRDIIETTSSIVLVFLAFFVFFTLLGYYARKKDSNKGMTRF